MSEQQPTVGEQLAVISYKLDTLLAGKDDHEARIRSIEDAIPPRLEERVTNLENGSHQGIGVRAVLTGLMALIPTVLWLYSIFSR